MCADESANTRSKKISTTQNALLCALAGPNTRAVHIALLHLGGLQLTRDETRAMLEYFKVTAFASARWPQHADLLYEWVFDLNLAHGWNLEVADHRLSMHQWTIGARPSPFASQN